MAIAAACRVASIISAAAHSVVLPHDVDETPQGYWATAAPASPVQPVDPAACLRSDPNSPHLTAPASGLPVFRDVRSSGATPADMTAPQDVTPGPNPPQFDALDANTAAVSLT